MSVLTIPTPSPAQDASLLSNALSENQVEMEEMGEARILLINSLNVTIILVPSEIPTNVSWVIESASWLDRIAQQVGTETRRLDDSMEYLEISLTAGGCLLLLVPEMANSPRGRRFITRRLCGANSTDLDSGDLVDLPLTAPSVPVIEDSFPPPPPIPSLQIKLLDQPEHQPPLVLNARNPIPFETDLFQGKALFIVRPTNPEDDPYWNERIFSKKKRSLVIQIQGKFKYEPQGVVYAGAEVSDPMQLGLVTKGVCTILLRLVESLTSNVHYSYGNSQEAAHIVGPAFTFFERIIATPPDETPPVMGLPFDESKESMDYRKRSKSFGQWNTTDTYSLEFFSMYINLTTWSLVNLPVSGNIALQTFWGNSLLKICMYEKVPGPDKKDELRHLESLKKFVFAVQIKYLGDAGQKENDQDGQGQAEDIMRWTGNRPTPFVRQVVTSGAMESQRLTRSESNVWDVAMDDDVTEVEDDNEEFFFDAEETQDSVTDQVDDARQSQETMMLCKIDAICPAWIEVCSGGKSYSKAFAIVHQKNKLTLWPSQACEDLVQGSKRINKVVADNFSPRISNSERTRRALGLAFAEEQSTDIPRHRIASFLAFRSISYDSAFLKRAQPTISERERVAIKTCGFLARAISDRHWMEEWATISPRRISFFHPEKRKPHFHVPFSSVLGVSSLSPDECPLIPGHYFLSIQTMGRTVYLMFSSELNRDQWLKDVQEMISKSPRTDGESLGSNDSARIWAPLVGELDNPAEEFMHKSSVWKCKNRRVLNCGLFSFRSHSIGEKSSLELVETALRSAVKASDEALNFQGRRDFLAHAAMLKDASVEGLSEDQKLVFFLNLYHVMILHAYLVLGPPNWGLQWISYFNNIAYQVDDDIFSLTELEHCVIRARMSQPSQLLSRFAIPKSRYPRMALLRKPDFRVNFALNCGSMSNPQCIYVYKEQELERQLDSATRLYLQNAGASVVRKSSLVREEVIVTLPRLCQWYMEDFGGSEDSLLDRMGIYLENQEILKDSKSVTIRFLNFSFECRPLSLRE